MNNFENTINNDPEAIKELQDAFKSISEQIKKCYEDLVAATAALGEYWKDDKYPEFKKSILPHVENVKEISERYNKWVNNLEEFRQILMDYYSTKDTVN